MPQHYIVRQDGTFKGEPETHYFKEYISGPLGRAIHWTDNRHEARRFSKYDAERLAGSVRRGTVEKE